VAGAPSQVAVPAFAAVRAIIAPKSEAPLSDTWGADVMLNQWGRFIMGCRI
jgi:hypothetical protein